MKNLLKKHHQIYCVPEDIQGAFAADIQKISENCIEVGVSEKDIEYYKQGEQIESFAVVEDGMLYFKPVVTEIDTQNNRLKVSFDKEKYEILQRREYTRVDFEKEFTLTNNDRECVCKCIDICAGGMKFVTSELLNTAQDYKIEFTLESTIPISCYFKPIRVLPQKGTKQENIISGRFIALKNIDKIAIVQFCFKKSMESTNK